jgi:hypothetical protein
LGFRTEPISDAPLGKATVFPHKHYIRNDIQFEGDLL